MATKKKEIKKVESECLTKEQMLQIIRAEGLAEYVSVEFDTTELPGEYCASVRRSDGFYCVYANGARCRNAVNRAFEKEEEAYYCLVEYMRTVKKEFGEYYKPHEGNKI